MTPLIDGDILLHEIGWSAEFKDKETSEPVLFGWDKVQELLDNKIKLICEEVEATTQPIIYLTDNEWLEKQRLRNDNEGWDFQPCFRYEIAKRKPYKGNRKNPKPYHFYNILAYLMSEYDCVVSKNGLEADDMMCIDQVDEDTIICSRDKDLRICPGYHYSWECGGQRSIGPVLTDRIGWLEKDGNDVRGYGLSFFYYQMLVGDSADNIPGLKGWGKVKAYNTLNEIKDEYELFKTVKQAYKDGGEDKEYFLEQANLLWMIQEEGVGYTFPKKCDK